MAFSEYLLKMESHEDAELANRQIAINIGLGADEQFSYIMQFKDGGYYIHKPDDKFLTGVSHLGVFAYEDLNYYNVLDSKVMLPDGYTSNFPDLVVPENWGICIGFSSNTSNLSTHVQMIKDAGFKWVRRDLHWDRIEISVRTAVSYVQPAVGSTVDIGVDRYPHFLVGHIISIPNGGVYTITAINGYTFTVRNDGDVGNAAPGTVIDTDRLLTLRDKYTFELYDDMINQLYANGIKILGILCYSNEIYEEKKSVVTEAGRIAYAAYAAAVADRYKDKEIALEIWNEPNIDPTFWDPQPSYEDYMLLVKAASPSIRSVDSDIPILGVVSSGVDIRFNARCVVRGLLDYVDGISIHPYNSGWRVEALYCYGDVTVVKRSLNGHLPDSYFYYPCVWSEMGYTTPIGGSYTEERQAAVAKQMFILSMFFKTPIFTWFVWQDDPDPYSYGGNYGIIDKDMQPKLSYYAIQSLITELTGYKQTKMYSTQSIEDYAFLFVHPTTQHRKVAAWTRYWESRDIIIEGKTLHAGHDPTIYNIDEI